MMEREINLLPPGIIAARALRIYLGRLGRLTRFVIFLSMIALSVTGLAYVVVWRTQALMTSQGDAESDHQAALVTQIQKVNAQLAALKAWQTENVAWTPLMPEMLRAVPDGISLLYIGVDSQKKVLEIRGTFNRRESLVAFQRRLEGLSWVASVESPLSNFQTGTDARFVLLVVRKGTP